MMVACSFSKGSDLNLNINNRYLLTRVINPYDFKSYTEQKKEVYLNLKCLTMVLLLFFSMCKYMNEIECYDTLKKKIITVLRIFRVDFFTVFFFLITVYTH